jgi:hypothetical protein
MGDRSYAKKLGSDVGRTGGALHPPRSTSKSWKSDHRAPFRPQIGPGNLDVMHDSRNIIVDDPTCLFRKGMKVSAARLECDASARQSRVW